MKTVHTILGPFNLDYARRFAAQYHEAAAAQEDQFFWEGIDASGDVLTSLAAYVVEFLSSEFNEDLSRSTSE